MSDAGGPSTGEDAYTAPMMDAGVVDAKMESALPPGCTAKMGGTGDIDRMIDVNGTMRHAVIHVPESYRASDAAPLVVVLHGLTEGPADIRSATHFDVTGDMRGWITVFPEGIGASWNGGVCCGNASAGNVDDVGFMRALVKAIQSDWCVDSKRIHATGFSNGGFMAHRLACEASDVFASIGVVAGQMGIPSCKPQRSVAVAQAHGTADPAVPYGGNPFIFFPATMDTMNGWAMRDGCGASPMQYATIGNTTCVKWPSCTQGADVSLCSVNGGVHTWFTGTFDATTYIADFLASHPM